MGCGGGKLLQCWLNFIPPLSTAPQLETAARLGERAEESRGHRPCDSTANTASPTTGDNPGAEIQVPDAPTLETMPNGPWLRTRAQPPPLPLLACQGRWTPGSPGAEPGQARSSLNCVSGKAPARIFDSILQGQPNRIPQAFFRFFNRLALSVGAGNFRADRPVAAFRGFLDDRCKFAFHGAGADCRKHWLGQPSACRAFMPSAEEETWSRLAWRPPRSRHASCGRCLPRLVRPIPILGQHR